MRGCWRNRNRIGDDDRGDVPRNNQEDKRVVQPDRTTEACNTHQLASATRGQESGARRYGNRCNVARNNQPVKREDKRVGQNDMATKATHNTMIVFDSNYTGPEGYHRKMTGMMTVIGHGVCSCLSVFFMVCGESTKNKEECKIVNAS